MADAAQDQIEIEWQYSALDVRPVLRWLESAAVPGYTVTAGKTKDLDDTYFDTEDWRVHGARFTCRVRRKGGEAELTLKSMADAQGGMRSRREVTETLTQELAASPIAAPGQCGQMLRSVAGKKPLAPIFDLRTNRRTYILADGTGELGEIAVDETTIPVGEDVPVRLSRVEVEVHADGVERARRFVDVLIAAAGLSEAGTSKFEAALIATGQQVARRDLPLGSTAVDSTMTAGEVAFAVLRKQLGAFLANEAGTRLGEDIEALHDMRVAARRLRAAMSAFAPFMSPRMQVYRQQLGWVAAVLGEVRDLDVQLERMAEWRASSNAAQAEALGAVEALLVARRTAARRRMLTALDSRRFEALVTRFAAVLRRGPARNFAPGRQPILAVAPDLVERRYAKLRKAGDRIKKSSPPEAYHALRIDAKKLRYALEFVGNGVYGKPALEFSARVTAIQDVLGLHQDAEVAITMLEEMAAASGRRLAPATILAMGAIAERYRVQAAGLRRQFPGVYKPLAGKEWNQLLKLMESRRPAVAPPTSPVIAARALRPNRPAQPA